ncbi:uncharacterized protein NECHADRAFT_52483, partial [Fusarium vanettenii 77-13-4]
EEEKLWQWVSPIDHFKTQMDKSRSRNPETRAGQWLLDSPEFEDFLSGRSNSLFCPGIPGAGKTVLTSVVVDYLLKLQKDSDGNDTGKIGVAFIYLDFKQEFELGSLLGSILRQLAADDPSTLDKLHKEHSSRSQSLPLSKARDILQSVFPSFSRIFIVVDALDEADQHLYDKLLLEIFHLQRTYGANIFATSRHIPDIERRFEGAKKLEIRASDEDVRNYVDSYITRFPRFVARSPELQEETRKGIVNAIDGMFLLATLHLDSLIGARSVRAFRDTIGSLPTGINAYDHAYGLALDRIEGQVQNRRDLAIEVLSWVAYARAHLTTAQLQHALAVIVGSTHFDESNIPDMNDAISVCAGLVIVDPGRDIVRLVHYTAQEYFDREKKKRLPHAQSHLTTVCLAYISLDCVQNISWIYRSGLRRHQKYPLYRYATVSWGYHARETRGHRVVMGLLLTRGHVDVNARNESRDTALHIAVSYGDVAAVELLLDHGADLNKRGRSHKTPAELAIAKDDAAIIRLLLGKRETELNKVRLLRKAASKGSLAVIRFLIDKCNVDVNSKDDHGQTVLSLSLRWKHTEVTKFLLANDQVDFMSKGPDGKSTALFGCG